MNAKTFVIGTIVGGIMLFVLGYVIFDLLLGSYMEGQMSEAAAQVTRDPPLFWAVGVACLAWAALVCHALGSRSGAGTGATVGAVVGVLLWLTADFFNYGIQTLISLQWAIVDPLLSGILSGIAGAAIGIVVGKLKSA
jgi:hypothetical protein